jgi:hypothetical protein
MPLFDFKCPRCSNWRTDVYLKASDAPPPCDLCDTSMEKLPPLVAQAVFAPGRSAESRAEWGAAQKARLMKRSDDYDASPQGKQAREEQIDKLRKRGTLLPGMKA